MKKIFFATTNRGKIDTFRESVEQYNIEVIMAPFNLVEPSDNISRNNEKAIEDLLSKEHYHSTLRDIARDKVFEAYNIIHRPVVALDSGFFVDGLNGFPGAFVNVALESKYCGIEKIIELLKNNEEMIPVKPRTCRFINELAYIDSTLTEPLYFQSISEGTIADKQKGNNKKHGWSAMNKIFIPLGYDKTLAEMTENEFHDYRRERKKISFATKFAKWYAYS